MKKIAVETIPTETSPTLKDFGKIIFYLVATVILGALLAPPLYWGAQWLNTIDTSNWPASLPFLEDFRRFQPWLAELPFRKFFHRGLLVAAIVLLWPTARWLSLPGIAALGLRPNPRRWSDLTFGFAASFLLMVGLAILLLQLDIYKMRDPIRWAELGKVSVSAVVVSLLEEGLFRGAILGMLVRSMAWRPALFWVSALYSILHFLKPQQHLPPDHVVNWLSGFAMIPGAFGQFQEPWLVLGGFVTLFLVGWIVGWARLKTGSLWMAIGLHAGWIFGTMGYSKVARRRIKDTLPWFGENLSIGIGSVIMVLLTGALVWWWINYRRKEPPLPLA